MAALGSPGRHRTRRRRVGCDDHAGRGAEAVAAASLRVRGREPGGSHKVGGAGGRARPSGRGVVPARPAARSPGRAAGAAPRVRHQPGSDEPTDGPAGQILAAGPFGAIVLVGTDDGAASRLEAVNVAAGCSWSVATEAAVIRRATIDPAGTTVYEVRVDRTSRADLGIWARPLDGSRPAARVLDPIEPDERFGRTFATEFAWDLVGSSLAVSSCGELACRTRVLDSTTGSVRIVAEPDLGMPVGLAGDALVSYAACPGVPCPIVATDLASGARTGLTEAGSSAVTVVTPDGPRLVHEVVGETGLELRSIRLDGSSGQNLGPLAGDQRLQPDAAVANAATRVPSGWVVLDPGGRLPEAGPGAETKLRHVPDGATVQLDEVAQ